MPSKPHIAKQVKFEHLKESAAVMYTYRCCDDPRTDSVLVICEPALTPDVVSLSQRTHQANVESKHEARIAAVEHLSTLGSKQVKDSTGNTHEVTFRICERREHIADEIVCLHYTCCDSEPNDEHKAIIDHIQWHTPEELENIVLGHMTDAAKHHNVRTFFEAQK